jgi:hypothetical protein
MHWIASLEKDRVASTLEKRLWDAADQFRAGEKVPEFGPTLHWDPLAVAIDTHILRETLVHRACRARSPRKGLESKRETRPFIPIASTLVCRLISMKEIQWQRRLRTRHGELRRAPSATKPATLDWAALSSTLESYHERCSRIECGTGRDGSAFQRADARGERAASVIARPVHAWRALAVARTPAHGQ